MKVLIIDIKIFPIYVSRILGGVETVLLILGIYLVRTFCQFPLQIYFSIVVKSGYFRVSFCIFLVVPSVFVNLDSHFLGFFGILVFILDDFSAI